MFAGGPDGSKPDVETEELFFSHHLGPGSMIFLDDAKCWHDADDLHQAERWQSRGGWILSSSPSRRATCRRRARGCRSSTCRGEHIVYKQFGLQSLQQRFDVQQASRVFSEKKEQRMFRKNSFDGRPVIRAPLFFVM